MYLYKNEFLGKLVNTTTVEYNQMIVGYKGDYKHNINEFE